LFDSLHCVTIKAKSCGLPRTELHKKETLTKYARPIDPYLTKAKKEREIDEKGDEQVEKARPLIEIENKTYFRLRVFDSGVQDVSTFLFPF